MAKITVMCPKCLARYTVDETLLGRTGQCSKCSTSFVLSTAADTVTRTLAPSSRARPAPDAVDGAEGDEDRSTWDVGDVILDAYEVKRLDSARDPKKHYAEGGMGVVYRVHHRAWDLDLAVKSPKPESFETEQGKSDFERECTTWIELGLHPNIVSCYYVRRIGGIPRVFAEFIEGGSLEDWIRTRQLYEGGPEKALRRVLDIAIQFAWGLHHAHEQGLIHQDVKPGNVMMQGEVPKVTDFGLAKARVAATRFNPDSTQGSMVVSWGGMTPAYCSPEQIEAAVQIESGVPDKERTRLTRRTDIWSWALTVFAMFCGKPPCRYGGQTAPQVFQAYLERPPDEADLPRMPDSLTALLRRCFAISPEGRPQTMQEVAEDLRAIYREVVGSNYPRQQPVATELKANSLNNRAASLLDLGRQTEAAELLEEAWQQHPWQPQVTHNHGVLRWRMGHVTDAELVAELEDLCKTRPQDWVAAHSLGLVQLERGEVKLAVKAFERAVALGGGTEVHATLDRARSLLALAPRCVRSFTGQPPFVTKVYLSVDGRLALSGIDQHKLRLWDVATGRSLVAIDAPGEGPTRSMDGRFELSPGRANTLRLEDLTVSGGGARTIREITWGAAPAANPRGPDGRWQFAQAEQYAFELREADTGALVQTFRGHAGPVNSVTISGDGSWVLSGSGDRTLRLWEVATGRCLRTLKGHTDPVNSVYLSADGIWALSASTGRRLRLWNLELLCSRQHDLAAPVLLCHVTSSEEAGRAQARFADLCASARAALSRGRYADAVALVRTARALPGYEVARDSLDLWALVGRRCIRRQPRDAWCVQVFEGHESEVRSVCLSPDGRRGLSASGDRSLRLWDLVRGRCTRALLGHTDWVYSVCFSPDGRRALSGSWDKTLRLWDLDSGRCLRIFQGHTNHVNSVAFAPDGARAFSGSWDKTLRFWDVATGRCLQTLQGHDNYVNSICPSGDGRSVLSGSEDQTLRLWDTATGECLRTFVGHTDWVHGVALSPDGRWALSGSKDRTVRLWDVATGSCQAVFEGHTGSVLSVALSADGRWALSGGKDGSIRLWEIATGRCQHVFEGHTGQVASVFLSPDGRWVLSGGEERTVRLWEIDWEYEFPGWSEWDERARPHLANFLAVRCSCTDGRNAPAGQPKWSEADFHRLLKELQHCGFGWLLPEGVRRELERMSALWQGPPPLPGR